MVMNREGRRRDHDLGAVIKDHYILPGRCLDSFKEFSGIISLQKFNVTREPLLLPAVRLRLVAGDE